MEDFLEELWVNVRSFFDSRGLILLYVAVIVLFGFWVFHRVVQGLRAMKDRRRDRLYKRKIATEQLSQGPEGSAGVNKKEAFQSIEQQFTISKRLLLPLLVLFILFLAFLPFMNKLPTAGISLMVAGFTVLLGIAARPWMENIIAGLVLSYSKALNIGDTVLLGDNYGTIEDINFTYTILKIWDWRRYVVPNQSMLQTEFINFTMKDSFFWVKVSLWIGYDADIDQVEEICMEEALESEYRFGDEKPEFWIIETNPSAIEVWITSWAQGPREGWYLRHDLRRRILSRFQKEKIPRPYQRSVLHWGEEQKKD